MIVAIVGPECSGKTTLAMQLADRLGAPWLPEFARGFFDERQLDPTAYTESHLEEIARGQLAAEHALMDEEHPLVLLDTDLIVIQVWWQERFGRVPGWVRDELREQAPREYLLARPDLAWQADGQRESPTDRDRLLRVYQDTLAAHEQPYQEVSGRGDQRTQLAEDLIRRALSSRHS